MVRNNHYTAGVSTPAPFFKFKTNNHVTISVSIKKKKRKNYE
jgi:hypothetical protein